MADKRIVDLPALQKVTDDTLIPVYQPGAANPAQRMSGKQFKEFGEGAVSQYAESASNAAAAAQSAYEGVKAALDNLPEGDTLIINDLTTGGTNAALSAEQGKALNDNKVNKAGDTMTGNLTVHADHASLLAKDKTSGRYTKVTAFSNSTGGIENYLDGSNYRGIRFTTEGDALSGAATVVQMKGGTWSQYAILHTGNKPSGSYTGNGDATSRTIAAGGIGDAVLIRSANGIVLVVGASGGFARIPSTGVTDVTSNDVTFGGGSITIKSTKGVLNTSGVTYYYQVL